MFAETIPLRFAGDGKIARVRELTGRDEFSVLGTDTAHAIDLLNGLIDSASSVLDLVATDRDRLLAAVYRSAFGDQIESTLTCNGCAEPFDLDFSLSSVIASVDESSNEGEWVRLAGGRFEAANGLSFRLPTGRDELEAIGRTTDEVESMLLLRCTDGREWPEGRAAFEELLERVAPIIDLELVATCPECRHVQKVQFDIQTYLLGALLAERRRLLADINCIARAYSWSLDEILSLARSDRRRLVELIENEYAA